MDYNEVLKIYVSIMEQEMEIKNIAIEKMEIREAEIKTEQTARRINGR